MLYLVSTPIGNLEDITLRALRILKEVDYIFCEDTRVTRKLLDRYQIKKSLISYHQHTSEKKISELVELVKKYKVALVTDAGTPGISDPGGKLIATLVETRQCLVSTDVVSVPGPSAVIAALSVSGLPTDKFLFLGFIPHKKGREKFLRQVLESKMTVVFYESCHRIIKCLEQLNTLINTDRNPSILLRAGTDKRRYVEKWFVVCRELTKKFETIYRGTAAEVLEQVKNDPVKGEYVVVVGN